MWRSHTWPTTMWLDPADVVARLRAGVPDLVEVGTARDLGAARIETILPPSAFAFGDALMAAASLAGAVERLKHGPQSDPDPDRGD